MSLRAKSSSQCGFTLVELVIFITVVGILAVGLMAAFSRALSGSGVPGELTTAMQLAQERMELILAEKRRQPFATFLAAHDPCSGGLPAVVCADPAGYTTASPAPAASAFGVDYREITVTVTGPSGAIITLTTLVADY